MPDSNAIYGVFHYVKRNPWPHFSACETPEEAAELAERLAVGEGVRNYNRRHITGRTPEGVELILYIVPHVEPNEEDDDADH